MKALSLDFLQNSDVVAVARQLLGKKICTRINNQLACGLVSEAEAYDGAIDRASHAWPNKWTARTKVLFEEGGRTYVYFCYGIHHLLNVVTGPTEAPQAVLIRSIIPTDGIETMVKRRHKLSLTPSLTIGPGNVAQALGLTREHNNYLLNSELIWLEVGEAEPLAGKIITTPRIGVDYAGPDKDLLWRFVWQRNKGKEKVGE